MAIDRKRVTIMSMLSQHRQSTPFRVAFTVALFSVVMGFAMTASAIPPPTRPYTVTRWVEDWSYTAGETLNVTMRITTNALDVSGMLYMHIAEETPEAWAFVALDDPNERVSYAPPQAGAPSTHNFSVNLQDGLPSEIEFHYAITVPADTTGLARIKASFVIEEESDGSPVHSDLVTDLYPPGLPEIDPTDDLALDNYVSQLRQQGGQDGWSFEVSNSGIITRSPGSLLGANPDLRPPAKDRKIISFPKVNPKALPASYDWRDFGPELPVSDQGNCGSCWAFALVGIAERLVAAKDGVAVKFSEQWVLDCNTNGWNCNGGWDPYTLFTDADSCGKPGLVLEAILPYQEVELSCECANPRTNPYAFGFIGSIDEGLALADKISAIKQAIMDYGPVWTTVHAGTTPFLAYAGGVFNYKPKNATIDHAVVIEGWDDSRGTAGVWIMRNSWSDLWGDNGYMYIEYDSSLIGSYTDIVKYDGSPNGSIQVTIEPPSARNAGAQWSVDGGRTWLDSGDAISNIVPGDYTIIYKDVTGFTKAADEVVTVGEKEKVVRAGTYVSTGEEEGEENGPETLEEIAEYLLQRFGELDANNDGTMSLAEAQEALSDLTPNEFGLLDDNLDSNVTRDELQAVIDGIGESGCCSSTGKSVSLTERVKGYLGDWLLVGLTLLALASLSGYNKTR